MKYIELTQDKRVIVDDEDYDYLMQWKWYYDKGYAVRDMKHYYMHRELIEVPDGLVVDHINRDRLDNRKSNLRAVSRQLNSLNRSKTKSNTSGYKGVYRVRDSWLAKVQLKIDGKRVAILLGYHNSALQASKAYNDYMSNRFGESFEG
jgi:hypothetical protein